MQENMKEKEEEGRGKVDGNRRGEKTTDKEGKVTVEHVEGECKWSKWSE